MERRVQRGRELLPTLQAQALALQIDQQINWLGARPQEEVLAAYRNSDLFVLASKVVADGDRDGLPNVLMEAQSQGLCCLATEISGIPELIQQGENGMLVPSANPQALSLALEQLIRSPELRQTLGQAGLARLQERFDMRHGIDHLHQLFHPAEAKAACLTDEPERANPAMKNMG